MNASALRMFAVLVAIAALGYSANGKAQSIFAHGFESVTLHAYDFGNKRLISFRADTPGTLITDVALVGLTAGENLTGIDFRPVNGLLYGLGSTGTVARAVNIATLSGAVAPVSAATFAAPGGFFFGLDFNPAVDRIRYTNELDVSLRVNPDDGTLVATDTSLFYLAGDLNVGVNPSVVHVAYATEAGMTATLYGLDSNIDALVRIGGVAGSPSANSGELTTIGALGVSFAGVGGFDIQKNATIGYAALRVAGFSNLYAINLSTGAATALGTIGPAASALTIDGLAIAP